MGEPQRLVQGEIDNICEEEGFVAKPYQDTVGVWGIGHGLTWLSEYESKMIVSNRFPSIIAEVMKAHPILEQRPVEVVLVTSHMAYNLGLTGLNNFKKMWAGIENNDYETAADEMLDSKWYRQVPARAQKLSDRMRAVDADD